MGDQSFAQLWPVGFRFWCLNFSVVVEKRLSLSISTNVLLTSVGMSPIPDESSLLIAFARAAPKAQEIESLLQETLIIVEVAQESKKSAGQKPRGSSFTDDCYFFFASDFAAPLSALTSTSLALMV